METLSWFGFGLFCVAAFVAGIRLLALWWRERLPAALLGAAGLLGIGPLGFVPCVLSAAAVSVSYSLGVAMWAGGFATVNLGAVAVVYFTATIFRPTSKTVRVIAAGVVVAVTACWIAELLTNSYVPDEPSGPAARVSDWIRVAALTWASIESLIYWRRMQRRLALGLADSVVANRFWLWGVGTGAAAIASGIDATVKLSDARAYELAWLNLGNSIAGITAAVTLLLAFLPPARYVAHVKAAAEIAHGVSAPTPGTPA